MIKVRLPDGALPLKLPDSVVWVVKIFVLHITLISVWKKQLSQDKSGVNKFEQTLIKFNKIKRW